MFSVCISQFHWTSLGLIVFIFLVKSEPAADKICTHANERSIVSVWSKAFYGFVCSQSHHREHSVHSQGLWRRRLSAPLAPHLSQRNSLETHRWTSSKQQTQQSKFLFANQQLDKHELSSEMIQKKLQQLRMKLKIHLKNKLGIRTFIASNLIWLILYSDLGLIWFITSWLT